MFKILSNMNKDEIHGVPKKGIPNNIGHTFLTN